MAFPVWGRHPGVSLKPLFQPVKSVFLLLSANGGDIYKKSAGRRCRKKGRLVLLALEYKLDSVCNAERFRGTGGAPAVPGGHAQKSITRTV